MGIVRMRATAVRRANYREHQAPIVHSGDLVQ